ncbi:hypothetical protein BJ741DRAFT_574864 [Chytriomyces cf. hyalinus JEL632]|nr:hypothetical protein BJ741DRAFT_574864 [Chytriomyces cf. hyalinus JEL632]
MFATSLERLENLSTDLDAVLCGLSLMGGPLVGLETLYQLLVDNGDKESDHDEAKAFFKSAKTAGNDNAIKIWEILQSIINILSLTVKNFKRIKRQSVICLHSHLRQATSCHTFLDYLPSLPKKGVKSTEEEGDDDDELIRPSNDPLEWFGLKEIGRAFSEKKAANMQPDNGFKP